MQSPLQCHWPYYSLCCCCSVTKSWLTVTPWTAAYQAPWPSRSPRVCSNPRPLSRWCHPTISSSVPRFSPCPQSFPGSGSSSMSWLLASGGQSTLFLLFPMLCTKSAWLTYFITGNLYHFIPSTSFPYLHTSLPFSNYNLFSVSMSLFLLCFVCLFLFVNSACKWHHMEVVFIYLFHSA